MRLNNYRKFSPQIFVAAPTCIIIRRTGAAKFSFCTAKFETVKRESFLPRKFSTIRYLNYFCPAQLLVRACS